MMKKVLRFMVFVMFIAIGILSFANEHYWAYKWVQPSLADKYAGPYQWAEPIIHGPWYIGLTIGLTIGGIILYTISVFLNDKK